MGFENSRNRKVRVKSHILIEDNYCTCASILSMERLHLQLVQGKNKFNVEMESMSTLRSLLQTVEELSGIPQSGQKLICQGQTLTAHPPDETHLHQLKLVNGSKIMVLGRKSDPEQDESYKKIVDIEKKTLEVMEKFVAISDQVQDIENGHLAKEHHGQALKDLERKCKSCSEAWMKILESLDGIQLDEGQTLARNKRKSVVNLTNAHLDRADDVLTRIGKIKA